MKVSLIITLSLLLSGRMEATPIAEDVFDTKPDKTVLFRDMTSKDGHYAVGWTIRPIDKTTKAVDWSLYDPESCMSFLDKYDYRSNESPNAPYELVDCFIDLKTMTTVDLPSTDPDYPHKNRGHLAMSDLDSSSRYALIQNYARFYTQNLWLVILDHGKPTVKDLAETMETAVDALVREKKTISPNEYGAFYSVSDPEMAPIPSFTDKEVKISFLSDIQKSLDPASQVVGTVTLHLPEGKVIKATSSTPVDNPFKDDPKLAKADRDLNKVYTQLYRKLSDVQQKELKKKQLDWINFVRDVAGTQIQLLEDEGNIQAKRNRALLEATQKRTAELKQQLDTQH